MACDRQLSINGQLKFKGMTKIYKINAHELHCPEAFIIGFAGSASEIIDVVDYYERPEIYKNFPRTRNLSGLILTQSGKIFNFDTPSKWLEIPDKFAAVGSGSPAAYGALHMGASPREAVIAASKVDPLTGMGVKVLRIK